MDEKRVVELLASMNRLQDDLSLQINAQQLVLIGLVRALGRAEANMEMDRAIADFAGPNPDERRRRVISIAQNVLSAAYDSPSSQKGAG